MTLSVNNSTPSFRGIVKLKSVFVDGKFTSDNKVVDSATKALKAVLVKEPDNQKFKFNNELFRKIYGFFDKEYKTLLIPSSGDTRHVYAKVRTGKDVFLVSGSDAADIAVSGKNIGGKRALERQYYNPRNVGSARKATENYHSMKSEIAARYLQNPLAPTVTLYTEKDKKGIVRLVAARMENSQNQIDRNPSGWTQTVWFNKILVKKSEQQAQKKTTEAISQITKAAETASNVAKPTTKTVETLPIKGKNLTQETFDFNSVSKSQKSSILDDLSSKTWDKNIKPLKKKKKPKQKIDPRQDDFFKELFHDVFDKRP